ncbi:MAG: hypothetical protein WA924_00635 [Burkholderiaceae bacterium]
MNLLGISDFGLFCAAALLNATPAPDTASVVPGLRLALARN